jgi:hypothetical protein
MQLTWKNSTKDQNLKGLWVDNGTHTLWSVGIIGPNNTHTEDSGGASILWMGFYGDYDGFQLISFAADGSATATAGDGDPTLQQAATESK